MRAERPSTYDRIASIEQFQSYLCGYSVRTCAQYLLWLHVTTVFCLFVVLLLVNSFLHAHLEVRHHPNETKYLFLLNNNSLFSIDIFYTKEPKFNFREIGERIVEAILAFAFTDIIMNAVAIIGLYNNKLVLMLPYMLTILWNITWVFCLLILEIIFTILNVLNRFWEVYLFLSVLLVAEIYRMYVFVTYYRLYQPFSTDRKIIGLNMITDSPMRILPLAGLDKPKLKAEIG